MGERLAILQDYLREQGCDGFVSLAPPANEYLSGFAGSTSALLATPEAGALLVDFRYIEQAKEHVHDVPVQLAEGALPQRAGEWLRGHGAQRIGFDATVHTVHTADALRKASGGELVPLNDAVSRQRICKDSEEIARVRAASELAEGVLRDVLPSLIAGVTEREIAAHIEYEYKARGAQGAAFDTIVLFGARSSLPHGVPGARELAYGDIVLIDMGCRRNGYCSDLTRTYAYGRLPDSWFTGIYMVVQEAQEAALAAARPGVSAQAVDAAARDIIAAAGYGEYFGHGLGHGVGLEIHEAPRLNRESEAILTPGMVVTIEPGIYLPGKGGVRIEDLVVITEDGCDILTKLPKGLEVIGA